MTLILCTDWLNGNFTGGFYAAVVVGSGSNDGGTYGYGMNPTCSINSSHGSIVAAPGDGLVDGIVWFQGERQCHISFTNNQSQCCTG